MIGFPWFTIGKYVAIALLIGGLLATVKIQSVRLDSARNEVEKQKIEAQKCYAQLETTVGINQNNDTAMKQAKDRYDRMAKSYEDRLKIANKKCDDLAAICNLPSSVPIPTTGGVPNAAININNPLLDRLNSLYP